MTFPREEVAAAVGRYVERRAEIERKEATWLDLAEFFTDDIVYVDPAWGRVEGIDGVRDFLVESMTGLEDWQFPVEFTAIEGDDVVVKWLNILPSGHRQSGWSRLIYAGNGKFRYEEDCLNMVHILEDLRTSHWRPGPGAVAIPEHPNRDFSIPPTS